MGKGRLIFCCERLNFGHVGPIHVVVHRQGPCTKGVAEARKTMKKDLGLGFLQIAPGIVLFLGGILELLYSTAESPHEFWNLFASEEQKNHNYDKNDLPWSYQTQ